MKALFILTKHQPEEETNNYFTQKVDKISKLESVTVIAPNVYLFDLLKDSQHLADLQHFAKISNYPYQLFYFDRDPVSYSHPEPDHSVMAWLG
jgi:hypothetical protein